MNEVVIQGEIEALRKTYDGEFEVTVSCKALSDFFGSPSSMRITVPAHTAKNWIPGKHIAISFKVES